MRSIAVRLLSCASLSGMTENTPSARPASRGGGELEDDPKSLLVQPCALETSRTKSGKNSHDESLSSRVSLRENLRQRSSA